MAFQFSENVGEAIKTAFGALADASEAHLAELASAVLSFLSGTALEPQLMAVCEATGMKPVVARKLSAALVAFYRGCLKRNLTLDEIRADLMQLGLSAEKSGSLQQLYATNKSSLMEEAVRNTLTVNQLEDIDWRFGLVAASKSMDQVGNTFLQMKIKRANQETVNVELTLEQFYSFLSSMEKAESTLNSF